jgi:hypothetical protein
MTDKKMVLEVGEQITALEQEITGLKAILMSTKQPDGSPIPWQWLLEEDMPTLLSNHVYERRLCALRQALGTSSDCTSLVRNFHSHICK